MAVTFLFAGVPVADQAATFAWWERFVGRPPDLVPHDHEVAWQLADAGWIYVVLDPERAGRGLLTLLVDDLEAHVAELAERAIEPVERRDGPPPRAVFEDPDGNRATLAQP